MSDPKTMGPFYANTYISQSHHCFTLHLECILRRDSGIWRTLSVDALLPVEGHVRRRAGRILRHGDEGWRMYVQVNVTLIVLFNYYYTFLQLDPKDMADQLKRAGGAIPAVRPGRATADYITKTLNRMSILGSAFLGALAAAPPLVEAVTGLQVKPLQPLSIADA